MIRNIRGLRIAVALSGGIDSSAAAKMLLDAGHEVVGVHMKNWNTDDEEGGQVCPLEQDRNDALDMCNRLGIEFEEISFAKEYWTDVFEPVLESYQKGHETPNPDTSCNKYIKFRQLKRFMLESPKINADAMATGHYALIGIKHHTVILKEIKRSDGREMCRSKQLEVDRVFLRTGADRGKDQTYFLSTTPCEYFRDVIFPLGKVKKETLKASMTEDSRFRGSNVISKPESMGICFIGKRNMRNFLGEYLHLTPGRFINSDDLSCVGLHEGKEIFTIGQRARIGGMKEKFHVTHRRNRKSGGFVTESYEYKDGDIFVTHGSGHLNFASGLLMDGNTFTWLSGIPPLDEMEVGQVPPNIRYLFSDTAHGVSHGRCYSFDCFYKARHQGRMKKCKVYSDISGATMYIQFIEREKHISPGQILALYTRLQAIDESGCDEDCFQDPAAYECLGGGKILLSVPQPSQ
jgi:tRNA-specific 2-thiouridylase